MGAQAGSRLSMRIRSDPISRLLAVAVLVYAVGLNIKHENG
jgi:uncharacterized membrane protein YfcA